MKPQRAFVAERAAAQHCAQLLRRGPEPAELLPQLDRLGDRFARQLAEGLARLKLVLDASGGAKPLHIEREAALRRSIEAREAAGQR